MNKTGIAIIFRKPKFPVIISTYSVLSSAFGMQELCSALIEAGKYTNQENIAIIDSTGDEFWYKPKNAVLMPGIFIKKWTKKRIIDLYNLLSADRKCDFPAFIGFIGHSNAFSIH